MKVYTTQPGLGVGVNLVNPSQNNAFSAGAVPGTHSYDEDNELNQHERERVIELMLSQERVISLLYEKTFPMTSTEMPGADGLQDMDAQMQMQEAGNDINDFDAADQEEEEYGAEAQYD